MMIQKVAVFTEIWDVMHWSVKLSFILDQKNQILEICPMSIN
jgi:hypothetical protein